MCLRRGHSEAPRRGKVVLILSQSHLADSQRDQPLLLKRPSSATLLGRPSSEDPAQPRPQKTLIRRPSSEEEDPPQILFRRRRPSESEDPPCSHALKRRPVFRSRRPSGERRRPQKTLTFCTRAESASSSISPCLSASSRAYGYGCGCVGGCGCGGREEGAEWKECGGCGCREEDVGAGAGTGAGGHRRAGLHADAEFYLVLQHCTPHPSLA